MFAGRAVLAVVALLLSLFGSATAQISQSPPAAGALPTLRPGTALRPPAVAAPDTARLLVTGPNRWPEPAALAVRPDTLQFGDRLWLTLDFPEPMTDFTPDSLRFDAPWVEPLGTGVGALPSAAGSRRVEVPLRIYRAGPLVVSWTRRHAADAIRPSGAAALRRPGLTSTVVQVAGRTAGADQIAAIREPRSLGWNVAGLLVAGVVAVVLALLIRWLWRRQHRPRPVPTDQPLAPPPELVAGVALWDLEQAGLTVRGDEHAYLDRLIQVVRTFMRDRFYLSAGELTAAEVLPAGVRLGYPAAILDRYAELIRAGDEHRYQPDPIARDVCRTQMARAVALIDQDCCANVITPVAAPLRLAAEQAWTQLHRRYGSAGATGASGTASPGSTGGTR